MLGFILGVTWCNIRFILLTVKQKVVEKILKIQNNVVESINQSFPKERVVCLLNYGSSLAQTDIPQNDYDFLLLLDSYNESDYQIIREIKKANSVEIFIDYWDQIKKKGFSNYQRGRHGSYFFLCLATAKCLLGENVYDINKSKVSRESIEFGLLHRIEEYFYRIQKLATSNDMDMRMIKKYFSRICMDMLLFTGEMNFHEVHTLHYTEIISTKIKSSSLFSTETHEKLNNFSENENDIMDIISILNNIHLNLFIDFKKQK